MELPHDQLLAPTELVENLGNEDRECTVLAVHRKRTRALELLPRFQQLEYLWISGPREQELELLAHLPKLAKLVVRDLRSLDLSWLEPLTRLKKLLVDFTRRITSLSALAPLTRLEYLYLCNLKELESLEPLRSLLRLEHLGLEGGLYSSLKVDSLRPIASLTGLKKLRLAAIRVADDSLEPLAELSQLRELFVANVFTVEESARLAAALPGARGNILGPYVVSGAPCESCGEYLVLPTGRRSRLTCPSCQRDRLDAVVAKYRRLREAAGGDAPKPARTA